MNTFVVPFFNYFHHPITATSFVLILLVILTTNKMLLLSQTNKLPNNTPQPNVLGLLMLFNCAAVLSLLLAIGDAPP